MATDMRMHVNDNGEYKTLHPETNSDQVLLAGGNTLQNHLNSTVPIKIIDGAVQFLNPETGEYENYSSDSLALAPLGKITNLLGTTVNTRATIKWTDPSDVTIDTNIKSVTIAKWKGTKLVMKQGSIPNDEKDGTIIVDSTVKNQYSTTGIQVNDLTYDATYYFKVFPYTETGVLTNSNDSVVAVTPKPTSIPNVTGITTINAGVTAYLFWTDPEDVIVDGEKVATWAGTKVVIKTGSYPTTPEDGTLLVDSKVKNKYSSSATALNVSGLALGTTYRLGFFLYTTEGAVTKGSTLSISRTAKSLPTATTFNVSSYQGTATIAWKDPADLVETILGTNFTTAIWKESKLVRKAGSVPTSVTDGTVVATNVTRDAYTAGFQDSGLTHGTTYYYKLFSTSTDGVVTETSLGNTTVQINDDTSGSPGPANLVAGDKTAGYYGYVPPVNLITGSALASVLGLSAGIAQYDSEGWLKFSLDGKILFVAKKPFRYNLGWDQIWGTTGNAKTVTIGGRNYKARLLSGVAAPDTSFENTIGSEWNRLMLPIHVNAATKTWDYPAYTGNVPNWGIGFTDADLITTYKHGNGAYSWGQERTLTPPGYTGQHAVSRGGYTPDYSMAGEIFQQTNFGWRPVLELIQ